MTAFDDWFQRKKVARAVGIREMREVSFTHKRASGPRGEFGGITLRVEPAEVFSFSSTVTWPADEIAADYNKSVLDGVIDELIARDVEPYVTLLRVTALSIEWHHIDFCQRAFYFAARGAIRRGLGLEGGPVNINWQIAAG
jgi:hypothetical protein